MDTQSGLNAGLLVGRNDELIQAQRLALPTPFVKVQDALGLDLELRIARKYPAAMLPGPDSIFVQPAPHGAVADAGHKASALRMPCHIGYAEPRQRQAQRAWRLARERLDLNCELWGEKPEGVPGGPSLRGPPIAL